MGILVLGWALPLLASGAQETSAAPLDDYIACGQVCLYAVARLKGVPAEFENVKKLVGPSRGGEHSLADLEGAAREIGLFPIAVSASRSQLGGLPMPAIAHMKRSFFLRGQAFHFVVLLAVRDAGAVILDPPFRTAFVQRKVFDAAWTGNLLLFADSAEAASKWQASFESAVDDRLKMCLVLSGSLLLLGALITIQWGGRKAALGGLGRAVRALVHLARSPASGNAAVWRRRTIRTGLCVLAIALAGVAPAVFGRFFAHGGKGPVLEAPSEAVDLGEFAPGQAKTTISLRNAGDQTLRIERVATSCGCAVPAAPSEIVAAGSANLELSLSVRPGVRSADLVIYSNDPKGPHLLTLRWYGSAVPQLLPPRIFAQDVALGSTYHRTVRIVYPGGAYAIVPQVAGIEYGAPGIALRVAKNDPSAFRTTKTLQDSKTTVGYLGLDVEVDSPTEPKQIDSSWRITVQYGKSKHVLTLPVKVSFVGKARAEPDAIVFSESQASAMVGKERRIQVSLDPSLAESKPQVNQSPAWLACALDRESSTRYLLHARVRSVPEKLCERGRITISAGRGKSCEASVDVIAFALRK